MSLQVIVKQTNNQQKRILNCFFLKRYSFEEETLHSRCRTLNLGKITFPRQHGRSYLLVYKIKAHFLFQVLVP